MKKTVIATIVVCLLFPLVACCLPINAVAPEGEAIQSATDFYSMSIGGSYYLAKDITLPRAYGRMFGGTLDGNGHTVTLIEDDSMFSVLSGATVKNLKINARCFSNQSKNLAALALKGEGRFENISVTVDYEISASAESFYHSLGGLIAEVTGDSSFEACSVDGRFSIKPSPSWGTGISTAAGGIVGVVNNAGNVLFKSCVNNVGIESAQMQMSIGGIAGIVKGESQTSFEDCVNNGEIICSGGIHSGTGGICGTADGTHAPSASVSFKSCDNRANLGENEQSSYKGNLHIGGVLGRGYGIASADFESCFNSGSIYSSRSGWATSGGIAGGIMTYGFDWSGTHAGVVTIKNCANVGEILDSSFSGGIMGGALQFNTDGCAVSVENSANYAAVYGKHSGGIIGRCGESGFNGLTVSNCYNGGYINGDTSWAGIVGSLDTKYGGAEYAITVSKPKSIIGCINAGKVRPSSAGAGIIGSVPVERVTVQNCVNAVECGKNECAISTAASKNIQPSGNLYLSNGVHHNYAQSASEGQVRTKTLLMLKLLPADTSEILAWLGCVGDYTADGYSSGWEEFGKARERATEIAVTLSSYDDAKSALEELKAALEGLTVTDDKETLILASLIGEADGYAQKSGEYTSLSFADFEIAYENAKYGRYSANPEYVRGLSVSLRAAIDSLKRKGNTDALYGEIGKYIDYRREEFTSCGWPEFREAMATALELVASEEPSEDDLSLALAALSEAAARLKGRGDYTKVVSKLEQTLERCSKEKYTRSSYEKFTAEIQALREVALEDDLSKSDVEDMLAQIDELASLLERKGEPTAFDAYIAAVSAYKQSDFESESWAVLVDVLERIELARADSVVDDLSAKDTESLIVELKTATAALKALPSPDESGDKESETDKDNSTDKTTDGTEDRLELGSSDGESSDGDESLGKDAVSTEKQGEDGGCKGSLGSFAHLVVALMLAFGFCVGNKLRKKH